MDKPVLCQQITDNLEFKNRFFPIFRYFITKTLPLNQ